MAPAGYHATTLFPEYFRAERPLVLAEESRMDCVAVGVPAGAVSIVEFSRPEAGRHGGGGPVPRTAGRASTSTPLALKRRVDGGGDLLLPAGPSPGRPPYSMDYDIHLRASAARAGTMEYRLGAGARPAPSTADARSAFAALVREGFVDGLLAGIDPWQPTIWRRAIWVLPWGRTSTPQRSVPNGPLPPHRTPSTPSGPWAPSLPSWSPAR